MLSASGQILRDYEQSLARVILFCISETPLSLGINKNIGILRDSKSAFFIDRNQHRLATYGVLPTFSREYLEAIIAALIEQSLIEVEMASEYEKPFCSETDSEGKRFSHEIW